MYETDEQKYTVRAMDRTTGYENSLFLKEFSDKKEADQYVKSLELQNLKPMIFNCPCDTEQ